jgi:tRNA(Arg) A34 adenosine deaminase TadA
MEKKFMDMAFEEAFRSMRTNLGGPFGAVIVRDGAVVGRGGNEVSSTHDPTAHAEVVAIRRACRTLGTFDLSGADLYATCEPCPMCLSAIYWANVGRVFYSLTRVDAENIGFRDNFLYREIVLPPADRSKPFDQHNHPDGEKLFREWIDKTDKTVY